MSIRIATTKEEEREIVNFQCPSNSDAVLRKIYRKQLRQLLTAPTHSKKKNENIRDLKKLIRAIDRHGVAEEKGVLVNSDEDRVRGGIAERKDDDGDDEVDVDVDTVIEEHRKRQYRAYQQRFRRLRARCA